jgi:hypothetical protein
MFFYVLAPLALDDVRLLERWIVKTDHPTTFVRATPSKISISENYFYKAQVHKNVSFEFQEAAGEIKLEYLCDGESRDFRWMVRTGFDDLVDKLTLLKQFKTGFNSYFNKKWPKRMTKWLGLRWLARRVERLCLGEAPGEKCFGVAALSDTSHCSNTQPTARTGYLVLRGYNPPRFSESWPEQCSIPLELPLNDLKQELRLSKKRSLTYKYSLATPPNVPVYISTIKLTDVPEDENGQLHSENDEVLQLEIPLVVDVGPSQVDEEGRIPQDTVIQWWADRPKRESKEEEGEKGQEDEEELQFEQLRFVEGENIPAPIKLKSHLEYLARHRGGYLLIEARGVGSSDKDELESARQKLKFILIQTAFQCNPFVPVFEPYDYSLNKGRLFVAPVPMVPPRGYDGRLESEGLYSNPLWIRSPEMIPVYRIVKNEGNKGQVAKQLAEILAALANTEEDGSVFLEAGPSDKFDEDYITTLEDAARRYCYPPLNPNLLGWVTMKERRGMGRRVARPSNEAHSVDNAVYIWEDGQLKKLSLADGQSDKAKKEVIEKVFKLMTERCKLDMPVVEFQPSIVYASLKGPYFDAREGHGSLYDPYRKILKWSKPTRFERENKSRTYKATLPVRVNRPVELYEASDLEGKIQVDFPQKLLSELDLAYFNALGEKVNFGNRVTIEKKSRVIIEFDNITLRRVFEWREFTAARELQFEGVRLSNDRLVDIQGMLADLGLEQIQTQVSGMPYYSAQIDATSVDQVIKNKGSYYITAWRPDGLRLQLAIDGELANINRERQEGKRIDRMRLPSGRIRIKINGQVEGNPAQAQELSLMLNRLQRLLKERFSYVRMQVP